MKKFYYILITFFVFFFFCSILSLKLIKNNTQAIVIKKNHISLTLNKDWHEDNSLIDTTVYKGKDGFVKISAITGENLKIDNIDNISNEVINSSSMKNNFRITSLKVDSQDARLIVDKNDNNDESILLVKYPSNVKIMGRGILFDYLQVRADKKHIKNIASSIKFIS